MSSISLIVLPQLKHGRGKSHHLSWEISQFIRSTAASWYLLVKPENRAVAGVLVQLGSRISAGLPRASAVGSDATCSLPVGRVCNLRQVSGCVDFPHSSWEL